MPEAAWKVCRSNVKLLEWSCVENPKIPGIGIQVPAYIFSLCKIAPFDVEKLVERPRFRCTVKQERHLLTGG